MKVLYTKTPIYRASIYRASIYRASIYRAPIYRAPINHVSQLTGPQTRKPALCVNQLFPYLCSLQSCISIMTYSVCDF